MNNYTVTLLSILLIISPVLLGEGIPVSSSPITTKQIIEHLDLKGGNFTFTTELNTFFAFILVERKNGEEKEEYSWSDTSSKKHEFSYIHSETENDYDINGHKIKYSYSNKEGGFALGYSFSFQSPKGLKQKYYQHDFIISTNKPQLLYSAQLEETSYALYFIASPTKEKQKVSKSMNAEIVSNKNGLDQLITSGNISKNQYHSALLYELENTISDLDEIQKIKLSFSETADDVLIFDALVTPADGVSMNKNIERAIIALISNSFSKYKCTIKIKTMISALNKTP